MYSGSCIVEDSGKSRRLPLSRTLLSIANSGREEIEVSVTT
jgi:hypothetical protein